MGRVIGLAFFGHRRLLARSAIVKGYYDLTVLVAGRVWIATITVLATYLSISVVDCVFRVARLRFVAASFDRAFFDAMCRDHLAGDLVHPSGPVRVRSCVYFGFPRHGLLRRSA